MNYMVSTYNDTLFTTAAAMFSAPAAVAALQHLLKELQRCAAADENTAAAALKTH